MRKWQALFTGLLARMEKELLAKHSRFGAMEDVEDAAIFNREQKDKILGVVSTMTRIRVKTDGIDGPKQRRRRRRRNGSRVWRRGHTK